MKNGLYLQGGGAKGAFQAGVLQAMTEKKIPIHAIAGTSIGAINGMILYYNGEKHFKELWYKMISGKYIFEQVKPVYETLEAIQRLGEHLGTQRKQETEHFWVNYLAVEKGKIWHQVADLVNLPDEKAYEVVSASSRLPNLTNVLKQSNGNLSYRDAFLIQVEKGFYDGYWLDGGLINNKFMEPFVECPMDTIYAVVFDDAFEVPGHLQDCYQKEQIIVIKPDFSFNENDNLAFTEGNLEKWYQAGYESACKIL